MCPAWLIARSRFFIICILPRDLSAEQLLMTNDKIMLYKIVWWLKTYRIVARVFAVKLWRITAPLGFFLFLLSFFKLFAFSVKMTTSSAYLMLFRFSSPILTPCGLFANACVKIRMATPWYTHTRKITKWHVY